MFYDLPDPMGFVKDISEVLDANGVWVFEQSYMPTMLERNSFDTICHEHLEYYTLKQIKWMLDRSGLRIIDVLFNDINGGSFRVYACHNDAPYKSKKSKIKEILLNEENVLELDTQRPYNEFKDRIMIFRSRLREFLIGEKERGKSIYIYGASTKGNVLLQFCDIDNKLIIAAADRNPKKWGHRTPLTNIPIVSEEEVRTAKPDYLLVLPWHFRSEFIEREKEFLANGGKLIFPLPQMEIVEMRRSYILQGFALK